MRSHFQAVLPESMAVLKKQIHDSNQPGKGAGINDAGLFYNVANVFSRHPGPITMGELSRELGVPLSTATRTMDWLVNNAYAERLPDPNDRRIVLVGLTKSGKETYQAIASFMMGRIEQAMNQLTPKERETFICLLDKVLSGFEEAAAASNSSCV
jgi:DNA-binding MarR family transcriptional regulator